MYVNKHINRSTEMAQHHVSTNIIQNWPHTYTGANSLYMTCTQHPFNSHPPQPPIHLARTLHETLREASYTLTSAARVQTTRVLDRQSLLWVQSCGSANHWLCIWRSATVSNLKLKSSQQIAFLFRFQRPVWRERERESSIIRKHATLALGCCEPVEVQWHTRQYSLSTAYYKISQIDLHNTHDVIDSGSSS